jgi:hypothetical protein
MLLKYYVQTSLSQSYHTKACGDRPLAIKEVGTNEGWAGRSASPIGRGIDKIPTPTKKMLIRNDSPLRNKERENLNELSPAV